MEKSAAFLLRRAVVSLLFIFLTASSAWATQFINEVKLIGGTKSDILTQIVTYINQGWTIIDNDLNENAGGDYILLMYKTDGYNDGFNYGSITGFYISNEYHTSYVYNGRTYYPVPCAGGNDFVEGHGDLNKGCGKSSDYIYLYYTRDLFPDRRVVSAISFNATQSGAVGLNGGSSGYDLNKGAGGDDIFMHVTTAEALDPLRIGDGTAGTNTIPFYLGNSYYPYSLSQQIYTPEDIGTAGSIKAISFHHRMENMSLSMNGVKVYMKHTDKASFVGEELDPIDGFVQVFEGTVSANGTQWMTIHLDTPFEYDGNRNLMICCYDPVGVHPGGNTFTYHAADNKMRRMATHDPIDLDAALVGVANTTIRNDIQLNIVPNPYRNPINLTVTGFTDKSASISWSAPNGTHPAIQRYEWQYKKSEDASWSALNSTTGTTASISGLSAFKEYMFRVKVVYSGGESSYSVFRFRTAQELPYTCGFENGMTGWEQVDHKHYLNIDYTGISENARHDGAYGYMFDGYTQDAVPQYLISPGLPNNTPITVSFYYRSFSSSNLETFQVGYSTTTRDISAFTWGEEITDDSTEWKRYVNNFPSGTQYIAVKYISNKYRLFLDDFELVAYSPYEKPSGVSVTEITDKRGTISWNAPDGATGYTYQFRQVNGGNWSAEASTNSTSVTLDNLSANTLYDFRVKALFGSYASNYVTLRFMSEGPEETLPHHQDFENGMGGWRLLEGKGRTGITTREHHEGSYSFEFDEDSPHTQFLRSPQLECNAPIIVSFYFKNYAEQIDESTVIGYQSAFQVGWSTSTSNLVDFVAAPEVEATNGQWTRFSLQLPKETKYVVILVKAQKAWLYVDDISIVEVPQPVATLATVMEGPYYVTTLYDSSRKWQLPEGALAYTVEKEGDSFVFYSIEDIVPAGTPVVVLIEKTTGDAETTKVLDLSITTASGVTARPSNILRGSDTPLDVTDGKIGGQSVFVLGIKDGKLGFYPFNGSVIPAGKAYYLAD